MMLAAKRREVAFAGQATLVIRRRVVEVAPSGGPTAAGEAALGLAEDHQVAQGPGRLVAVFGPCVGAVPGLQVGDLSGDCRGPLDRGRSGRRLASPGAGGSYRL